MLGFLLPGPARRIVFLKFFLISIVVLFKHDILCADYTFKLMRPATRARGEILRRLLAPVVRFCLRNSINFQEVLEALKAAFVELSARAIIEDGEKVTVSRMSIMTGLNRRDVTRISRHGPAEKLQVNLVTRVIGQWQHDPRFQSKGKKARVLSYTGEDCEFKSLVEAVSKDMNPATMLFELKRLGLVELTRDGVKLIKGFQDFHEVPERALDLLARDLGTLTQAVEENIFKNPEPRNLHLRTEYDNIFLEDLPHIREWIVSQGVEYHKRIREFLSNYDQDLNPQRKREAGGRVVVGSFSWTTSVDPKA